MGGVRAEIESFIHLPIVSLSHSTRILNIDIAIAHSLALSLSHSLTLGSVLSRYWKSVPHHTIVWVEPNPSLFLKLAANTAHVTNKVLLNKAARPLSMEGDTLTLHCWNTTMITEVCSVLFSFFLSFFLCFSSFFFFFFFFFLFFLSHSLSLSLFLSFFLSLDL